MAKFLPFSAPGRERTGRGNPAGLDAEARRLMYLSKLIGKTAGVPIFRMAKRLPDGSLVQANLAGVVERVKIHAEADVSSENEDLVSEFSRLVWFPEGFVFTPRTVEAPNGYGLPQTEDGVGTPGGKLRQVIVNRFAQNQYPDAVIEAAGGVLDQESRNYASAPLFFAEWELADETMGLGVRHAGEFIPQFSAYWTRNFKESEGKDWICHRPMHVVYGDTVIQQEVRARTNALRAIEGREAMHPPIRGTEGELSTLILDLQDESGVQGHDSRDFKPGHQSFVDRLNQRSAWADSAGENVLWTVSTVDNTAAYGQKVCEAWQASPPHYANMISLKWQQNRALPVLDFAAQDLQGTLTRRQLPPYSIDSAYQDVNLTGGSLAGQIFQGRSNWVEPVRVGSASDETDSALSVSALMNFQGHRTITPRYDSYVIGDAFLYYKGRKQRIYTPLAGESFTALACKLHTDAEGQQRLRVIGYARAASAQSTIVMKLLEGKPSQFLETSTEIGRYALPSNVVSLSMPKFSESGARLVFSFSQPMAQSQVMDVNTWRDYLWGIHDGKRASPVFTASNHDEQVWGDEVTFVEFVGEAFSIVHTSHIEVLTEWGAEFPGGNQNLLATSGFVKRTCTGEARLLGDYQGESLVFASVSINSIVEQRFSGGRSIAVPGFAFEEEASLDCKLLMPDGGQIPYLSITRTADQKVSGFLRHFFYLDLLDSSKACFLEYEASGEGDSSNPYPALADGANPQKLSMRIVTEGREIKRLENILHPWGNSYAACSSVGGWWPTQYTAQGVFHPYGSQVQRHFLGLDAVRFGRYVSRDDVYAKFYRVIHDHAFTIAATRQNATLMPRSGGLYFQPTGRPEQAGMIDASQNCSVLGPMFIGGSTAELPNSGFSTWKGYTQAAHYKGEYLHAGVITNTVFDYMDSPQGAYGSVTWAGDGFEGENRYFFGSSLPLDQITGLILKGNVLPIGVL